MELETNGSSIPGMSTRERARFLMPFALTAAVVAQTPPPATVATAERDAVVDALAARVGANSVLPEAAEGVVRALRAATTSGEFDRKAPMAFVEAVNRVLADASHDRHLAIFYQPASGTPPARAPEAREPMNFGFVKFEGLRGNVAYLEILTFADLGQLSAETASAWLSTLANFDAIILDLRRNGGGNTPMMAFVATFFFESAPVHLTDIYWRDTNQTAQFWTTPFVPGRRSPRQPLYILTSASTFSAAEDFCYTFQNLKRATVVGERTGGGAHSGRGLQRLTPSFTAFIPVGRSVSPVTGTNWEGTGVKPDVETPADSALAVAHARALEALGRVP